MVNEAERWWTRLNDGERGWTMVNEAERWGSKLNVGERGSTMNVPFLFQLTKRSCSLVSNSSTDRVISSFNSAVMCTLGRLIEGSVWSCRQYAGVNELSPKTPITSFCTSCRTRYYVDPIQTFRQTPWIFGTSRQLSTRNFVSESPGLGWRRGEHRLHWEDCAWIKYCWSQNQTWVGWPFFFERNHLTVWEENEYF